MEKSYFMSKTFWAALLGALGSVGAYLSGSIDVSQLVVQVMAFLAVFGVRDAL